MLSIFIMLIIAIGLCAGIGYSILTLIKTGEVSLGIQKNQAQVENIVSAIRSNLRYVNGIVVMPIRDPAEIEDVPLSILPEASPFRQTAYGMNIAYCPVSTGEVGPVDDDVYSLGSGDGSYNVRIRKFDDDGKFYVIAGAPQLEPALLDHLTSNGIVAYLISPAPGADLNDLPGCADIEFANEGPDHDKTILAIDGQFTPVYARDPQSTGQKFTLDPSAEAESGVMLLENLGDLDKYIRDFGVMDATVLLPTTISVSASDFGKLAEGSMGRSLRIIGADGGSTMSVTGASGKIVFGGDAVISDVDFVGGSDVELVAGASSRVLLKNVFLDRVAVEGGRMILADGTSVVPQSGSAEPPIRVEGGDLVIEASAGSPVVFAPSASAAFEVKGGSLFFASEPSVTVSEGGRAAIISGNGRISGTGHEVTVIVNNDSEPAIMFSQVTETEECLPGSAACTAQCEGDMKVVVGSGSCSSADGHALAGFGITNDGTSYTCTWSTPMAGFYPDQPTASVVCR